MIKYYDVITRIMVEIDDRADSSQDNENGGEAARLHRIVKAFSEDSEALKEYYSNYIYYNLYSESYSEIIGSLLAAPVDEGIIFMRFAEKLDKEDGDFLKSLYSRSPTDVISVVRLEKLRQDLNNRLGQIAPIAASLVEVTALSALTPGKDHDVEKEGKRKKKDVPGR